MANLKMYHPFFIGARLAPAIKIGHEAVLTLIDWETRDRETDRFRAHFVLEFGSQVYEDDELQSGVETPWHPVEAFSSFLDFLGYAAASTEGSVSP